MSEQAKLLSIVPGAARRGLLLRPQTSALGIREQVEASLGAASNALYVAQDRRSVDLIFRCLPLRSRNPERRLLVLPQIPAEQVTVLRAHFRVVLTRAENTVTLVKEELLAALQASNRADLLVAAQFAKSHLVLYRGDLEPFAVPVGWFARNVSGKFGADDVALIDYGQTLKLGEQEVAADASFYEFDESFRHRAKQRLRAEDKSLGGSIRRLRLQKGLRQCDFPDVSAKEIARIESGAVAQPHATTLERIAHTMSVPKESLATY